MSHFLSSTIVLETGAFGTFDSICKEAITVAIQMVKEFHIKNTVVEFKFNDILFRVNENTDINKAWEHYVKIAKVKVS